MKKVLKFEVREGTEAMKERYFARSASDKTDDWPFWFVADQKMGGLNVTARLLKNCGIESNGATLLTKINAISLAKISNQELKGGNDGKA